MTRAIDDRLRREVEALAGLGMDAEAIALLLDALPETVEAACATELRRGVHRANVRVAESLYRKATGDGSQSVSAAVFWLKTRARWKEATLHEHFIQTLPHEDALALLQ